MNILIELKKYNKAKYLINLMLLSIPVFGLLFSLLGLIGTEMSEEIVFDFALILIAIAFLEIIFHKLKLIDFEYTYGDF